MEPVIQKIRVQHKHPLSIEDILQAELEKMMPWNNHRRMQYIAKRKIIKRFSGGNIYSSGVYLLDNYLVAKHLYPNMTGYTFWKNEVNALKRVYGRPHFPQLVAADPERLIIYMTYCGPSLASGAKVPADWPRQVRGIKQTLLAKQVNPNDILPRNVCVRNGLVHIIDFGLSNIRHSEMMSSIRKLEVLLSQRT